MACSPRENRERTSRHYVKVPGILKRRPGSDKQDTIDATDSRRTKRCNSTGGIRWDEKVIAEHDKLRGTRTRINEPQTPYCHWSDSGDHLDEDDQDYRPEFSVSPHDLAERLCRLNSSRNMDQLRPPTDPGSRDEQQPLAVSEDEETCEEPPSESLEKHKTFEKRRKAHYNEYRVLQMLRSSGSLDVNE